MVDCQHLVIDGHSLLLGLPGFSPRHRANPRLMRGLLVRAAEQFQDHTGVAVHIVFDGRNGGGALDEPAGVEVRFAAADQTADAIIERAVAAAPRPGQVAVVTGDATESRLVQSLGAQTLSPDQFLDWLARAAPSAAVSRLLGQPV